MKILRSLINVFKKINFKFMKKQKTKMILFSTCILSMITGILFISIKSTFNMDSYKNLSPDYGDSLKINMQVSDTYEHGFDPMPLDKIVDQLYGQTSELGLKNITINNYGTNGITVTVPGSYNQFEKRRLVDYITSKPTLTFRDQTDKSLFLNGSYDSQTPSYNKDNNQDLPFDLNEIKIKNNSMTNTPSIWLKLKSPTSVSRDKLSTMIEAQVKAKSHLVLWLGYEGLYNSVANTPGFSGSLYQFAQSVSPDGSSMNRPQTIYDENELVDYNLSANHMNIDNLVPTNGKVGDSQYYIISNRNWGTNNKLVSNIANRIKYSANKFTFKTISVSTSGSSYSNSRMILIFSGIGAILILILLWIMWSYGLLGAVTSLSLLLIGMTNIAIFNIIDGEISSGSIITFALLFVVVAAIAVWQLLIFKREILAGSKQEYALNRSKRNSLSMILDLKFMLILTTFTFFYFTIGILENISIMSMFFLLVSTIGILFWNRWLINLISSTNYVSSKILCGAMKNKINNKLSKWTNTLITKMSTILTFKWVKRFFVVSFTLITSAGTLFIIIFSTTSGSISSPFALGSDFKTKYSFDVVLKNNNGDDKKLSTQDKITKQNTTTIKKDLKKAGINFYSGSLSVETIYFYDANQNVDTNKTLELYTYEVTSTTAVNLSEINIAFGSDNFIVKDRGNHNAIIKIKNTLFANYIKRLFIAIALAMIPGMVYLIFRFRWSSALSLLQSLIINIAGFFSIAAIFRIPITFTFIEVLLFSLLINLTFGVFLFNLIKTKLKPRNENNLDQQELTNITQEVKVTLKPFFIMITFLIVIVLIIFAIVLPVTNLPTTILLMLTVLLSVLLTYNWMPKTWVYFENKRIQNHVKIKNMKLTKLNEQIFKNIND